MSETPTLADLHERLTARFRPDELEEKPGRGTGKLTYMTAEAVIRRLNEVARPGNWSTAIRGYDPATGAVHYALTILGVTMEDFGDPNNPMHGDKGVGGQAYKESCTDGLKRCARLFGIGLYLWDEKVSIAAERQREGAAGQQRNGTAAASQARPFNDRVQEPPASTPPTTAGSRPDVVVIDGIECAKKQSASGATYYETFESCLKHPSQHFIAKVNREDQLSPFVHKDGNDWCRMPAKVVQTA